MENPDGTEKFGQYFTVTARTPEYEPEAALLQAILDQTDVTEEFYNRAVADLLESWR